MPPKVGLDAPRPIPQSNPQLATDAPRAAAGEEYVTRKGDTLWEMAVQAYGDGRKWTLIRDANPDKVKGNEERALIGIGVKFVIPEKPAANWGPKSQERRPAPQQAPVLQPQQAPAQARPSAPQPPPPEARPSAPQPAKPPEPPPPPDKKKMSEAATELYDAMKGGLWGVGTDEDKIFKALEGRSPDEIKMIRAAYADHYKRDLDKDLKGELSGSDLKRATALMNVDQVSYDVATLKNAMYGGMLGTGMGTDEKTIFQTLEGKSPAHLLKVQEQFKNETGKTLDQAFVKELSGDELRRARALLAGDKLTADAAQASHAMKGGLFGAGTDEDSLMKALEDKTPEEIDALRASFKARGRNLDLEVEHELSGAELKRAKALLGGTKESPNAPKPAPGEKGPSKAQLNRAMSDAAVIDYAMHGGITGLGTDVKTIERTLEGKKPEELELIKQAYLKSTNGKETLEKAFEREMSGDTLIHAKELLAGTGDNPASKLRKAMGGWGDGTDEDSILEQLQGRSKPEIQAINNAYTAMYKRDLVTDLTKELEGRDLFDAMQAMKGEPENAIQALERLNEQLEFERKGGQNAISRIAMDVLSNKGELLESTVSRANDYYQRASLESQAAGMPQGMLTPEHEEELANIVGYGRSDVKGYRTGKDAFKDGATTVATGVAAVGVTFATGGTAAPLVAMGWGALAGAGARVMTAAAIDGKSYSWTAAAQDTLQGSVDGGGNMLVIGAQTAVGKTIARELVEQATANAIGNVASGVTTRLFQDETYSVEGLTSMATGVVVDYAGGFAAGAAFEGAFMAGKKGLVAVKSAWANKAARGDLMNKLDEMRTSTGRFTPKSSEDLATLKVASERLRATGGGARETGFAKDLNEFFGGAGSNSGLFDRVKALQGPDGTFRLRNSEDVRLMREALDKLQSPGTTQESALAQQLSGYFAARQSKKDVLAALETFRNAKGQLVPINLEEEAFMREAMSRMKYATLTPSAAKVYQELSDLFSNKAAKLQAAARAWQAGGSKFKPGDKETQRLVNEALDAMKGRSGRLAPGNPQELAMANEMLTYVSNHGTKEDLFRHLTSLRTSPGAFEAKLPGELKLMQKVFEGVHGPGGRLVPETADELSLAAELKAFFENTTTPTSADIMG